MANNLDGIMPKILARALKTLRESCVMPMLVNADYSNEAAMKGATIDVPIPTAIATRDVAPSATPITPVANVKALVQIPLDNWKQNDPIFLTDKELTQIDLNAHYLPMQVAESVRGLAKDVNVSLLSEYKGIYGYVGAAGTTPFATDPTAIINARKTLNQQFAWKTDRRCVMDNSAEANALGLNLFNRVNESGSDAVILEGQLGRKFGFDCYAEDQVLSHTSTPFTAGAVTVNGAHTVNSGSTDGGRTGTISLAKITNSTPLVKGDILTFAGDTQTYVVLTDITVIVGNTTVSIAPALQTAKSGAEAVTLKATHVVNLAFHRDAFAFAMRPLLASTSDFQLGSKIMSMQDPKTGIVLRLEVSRQHKQVVWEFDLLWGAKLVRPELACRIAG